MPRQRNLRQQIDSQLGIVNGGERNPTTQRYQQRGTNHRNRYREIRAAFGLSAS